jgi:hypothetical protein
MKDVTEFTDAEKRTIEECFGVTFEYFVIEQEVQARYAEFYRLTIDFRQLREVQQRSAVDA